LLKYELNSNLAVNNPCNFFPAPSHSTTNVTEPGVWMFIWHNVNESNVGYLIRTPNTRHTHCTCVSNGHSLCTFDRAVQV